MEFFYLVWFYGVWKWHIHLIFIKDMMMILESSSWQLIEEVEIEFEKLRRDWFNLEIEEFGILNYAFLDFTNSIFIYEYTFSFSIQFLYAGFLIEVSYGAVRIVIGVFLMTICDEQQMESYGVIVKFPCDMLYVWTFLYLIVD